LVLGLVLNSLSAIAEEPVEPYRQALNQAISEQVDELPRLPVAQRTAFINEVVPLLALQTREQVAKLRQHPAETPLIWIEIEKEANSLRNRSGTPSSRATLLGRAFEQALWEKAGQIDGAGKVKLWLPPEMVIAYALAESQNLRHQSGEAYRTFVNRGASALRSEKLNKGKRERIVGEQYYPDPWSAMLELVKRNDRTLVNLIPNKGPAFGNRPRVSLREQERPVNGNWIDEPDLPERGRRPEGVAVARNIDERRLNRPEEGERVRDLEDLVRKPRPPEPMAPKRDPFDEDLQFGQRRRNPPLPEPTAEERAEQITKEMEQRQKRVEEANALVNAEMKAKAQEAALKKANEELAASREALKKEEEARQALLKKGNLADVTAQNRELEKKLEQALKEKRDAETELNNKELETQLALNVAKPVTKPAPSVPAPAVPPKVDASAYLATVTPGQNDPELLLPNSQSLPPPLRGDRTFLVSNPERRFFLQRMGTAWAKYAELLQRPARELSTISRDLAALNQSVADAGVEFPPLEIDPNGEVAIAGDTSSRTLSRPNWDGILESLANQISDLNAPANPLAYLNRVSTRGDRGSEYFVYEGQNAQKQQQVLYFDPTYFSEIPVTLTADGGVNRLRLDFSSNFQLWTAVRGGEWRLDSWPGSTEYPVYLRPKAGSSYEWELGIEIDGRVVYETLSGEFWRSHGRGGSWGRLSSLFAPGESELETRAQSRLNLETEITKKIAELDSKIATSDDRGRSEAVARREPLANLRRALFSTGGRGEKRSPRLRLASAVDQPVKDLWKEPGPKLWHLNGLAFPYPSSGSAVEVGKENSIISALAFDRTGTTLLAGDASGNVSATSLSTEGKFRRHRWKPSTFPVQQIGTTPNGKSIVTLSDGIQVWNAETFAQVHNFPTDLNGSRQLLFSDDSTLFFLADSGGKFHSFDLEKKEEVSTLKPPELPKSPSWRISGQSLAVKWNSGEAQYDATIAAQGQISLTVEKEGYRQAFQWAAAKRNLTAFIYLPATAEGHWCATADEEGYVRVWRLEPSQQGAGRIFLVSSQKTPEGSSVSALASPPSGGYLASGDSRGVLRVQRVAHEITGELWKE